MKITIDGVDFEVSDQVGQAVGKLQKRLKDAEEETKKEKDEKEKLEKDQEEEEEKMKKDQEEEKEKMKTDHKKEIDALSKKVKDAEARVPTPETLDSLVENRLKTRDAAKALDSSFVVDGKDCETIRKELVGKFCSDVDLKTATADYIRARFDALASGTGSVIDNAIRHAHTHKDEKKFVSADEARAKAAARNRDAWKRNGSDK